MTERTMTECKERYVALSYVWGDATAARREIIVNGEPAFITENLHAALTHMLGLQGLLASLLGECELWVDAVCINQQDATEKFKQVAHMKAVFANAQWVVAWMGLAADGSDELLRALNETGSVATTAEGGSGQLEEPSFCPKALHAFLAREWWTRMWTFQEFMVPFMLWFVCGHSYAHSYDIFGALNKAMSYLDRTYYYIFETEFSNLLAWRMHMLLLHERFMEEKELPLLDLIEATKDAKCTDPRDRIFALLGLMGQDEKRHLNCDYKSSPCEVFCNAIRVMAIDPGVGRAAKVTETVDLWKRLPSRGGTKLQEHDPLQQVVPARWECDGIACSSLTLCLHIAQSAKTSGKDIARALIMGSQGSWRDQGRSGDRDTGG
ncbi:hypothetical protein NEMBOFW57_010907 [Staphylotrichum longicolle]|uniref:Heterokaryon incompatibility domain-containing protein n=1 Tax=Staphylotrichum longicolle TaxID=669026 RepID=A0AAD4ENJ7_9PEZI|nr:hypothetical protein NEMBOFW57_010907 [Staphylotrichum longicolle]